MKHVFFDEKYDEGRVLMHDLEIHEDCLVIYRDCICKNKFVNKLYQSLLHGRLKRRLGKPIMTLLWRLLFRLILGSDVQTISFSMRWYYKEWLDIVRTIYPQTKFVLILRDTVQSNTILIKEFHIEEAKKFFNLILSYDSLFDVPTYGLTYAPVYMSKFEEFANSIQTCKYDIAFIAAAKDRLDTIHKIYKNLVANGMRSYFYIYNAKETERLTDSAIVYGDVYLERFELLRKELESNCILEVLKGDANSNTLRFLEAVFYNKKLYTNWKGVVNSPYYDPRYIKVFEKPEDLDYGFIKERIDVDYKYKGELSPIKLLDIIR